MSFAGLWACSSLCLAACSARFGFGCKVEGVGTRVWTHSKP